MILANRVYLKLRQEGETSIRYRVVKISQFQDEIAIIDIDYELAFPEILSFSAFCDEVNQGKYELIDDPFVPTKRHVSAKAQAMRDKAYESIEELVKEDSWDLFYSDSRGKLIKDAAVKRRTTVKELYSRLRRHWQRGMVPNAQLPFYRRPNKQSSKRKSYQSRDGYVVTDADKIIIGKFYRAYYLRRPKKGRRKSEKQVHILMLRRKYTKKGLRIPHPTQIQFRYWGRGYTSRSERIQLLSGPNYPLQNRPRIITTADLYFGPGSEFQIDATRYIVYLVSQRNPYRIVGTPVVYIVRDCFARMTVGLAVTLFGPSWEGAILALESVARNKVEFCLSYGIEIEPWQWPSEDYCNLIKADRGELLSPQALAIVKGLKIYKSNTPPFRGDLKGYVEGEFIVAENDVLPWTPGASYDIAKFSGQDYRLDALFDIKEFTRRMIRHTLKYNLRQIADYQLSSDMLADGIKPVPLELWNWGIANRSGALRHLDPEFVRSELLPVTKGSISRNGVYVNQLWYTPEDSRLMDLVEESSKWRTRVEARHDPRTINTIRVHHMPSGEWIPCELRPDYQVYKDCTLEEYRDELALRKKENIVEGEIMIESETRYQEELDEDLKQAQLRKAEFDKHAEPMTKKERLGGTTKNREDESNRIRREEAGAETNQDVNVDSSPSDEETYIPTGKIFDHLQERLNSQKKEHKDAKE